MQLEYKGYLFQQIEKNITISKNGVMVMHTIKSRETTEEEAKKAVELCIKMSGLFDDLYDDREDEKNPYKPLGYYFVAGNDGSTFGSRECTEEEARGVRAGDWEKLRMFDMRHGGEYYMYSRYSDPSAFFAAISEDMSRQIKYAEVRLREKKSIAETFEKKKQEYLEKKKLEERANAEREAENETR